MSNSIRKSGKESKNTLVIREKQKIWLQNLIALKFPVQLMQEKYCITISSTMFEKPNKKGFEIVCHFLFSTLDKDKAAELFKFCYPAQSKKQWQDFRTVCLNWWKRIAEENPLFDFPRVSNTMLMSPAGPDCYKLLFAFSTFVLYREAVKMNGKQDSTLLPPMVSKSGTLTRAQVVVLKSACHSESQGLIRNMQLSKHIDEEATELAGNLQQKYRTLVKRKKELECLRDNLKSKLTIPTSRAHGTASRTSAHQTPEKGLRSRINHDFNSIRAMWKKLDDAHHSTAEQREVVDSVVSLSEEDIKLDAARLAPKVPAILLQQCADKVHENVGTSLYQAGELNLVSLVTLFNLSLRLVIEKLHEVGVPNFESQIPFVSTQSNIHKKNIEMLNMMQQELNCMIPQMKTTSCILKSKIDQHYADKQEAENTLILGLPKPDFQSTEIQKTGDENDNVIGLLAISPPFQFSDNIAPVTPPLPPVPAGIYGIESPRFPDTAKLHIENSSPMLSATLTPHSHSCSPSVLSSSQSLRYSPSVKQGALEFGPGCSPKTSRKGEKRKDTLQKRMAKRAIGTRNRESPAARLSMEPQKASSLPSTPISKPSNDLVIEKVKSRTPEAVRKLVEQVVNYTTQEMSIPPGYKPSDSSPADAVTPAFFDIASQLDAGVFESRDKIERTPPTSLLHQSMDSSVRSEIAEVEKNSDSRSSSTSEDSSTVTSSEDSAHTEESHILDEENVPFPNMPASIPSMSIPYRPYPATVLSDPFSLPGTPVPGISSVNAPMTPFHGMDFSNCQDIMDSRPPDFLDDSFLSPKTPEPSVPVGNLIDL